ncbi:MAG: hypothetical protein JWR63_4620, partial [Conexibacter sp.]|nr:hypothetical protein [Conexibacter sp.]
QERTFRRAEDPTPLDRLLRVLYYSVWCYVLVAAVALIFGVDRAYIEQLYDRHQQDPAQLVWRAAIALLAPSIAVATATRLWEGSPPQRGVQWLARINGRHEQPTGWDWFFEQTRCAYVRIALKGGGWVFGFYGSASFAAYAKDGGDLYLERVYARDEENNWFGEEMKGNIGVWVKMDDVVSTEFYDPDYEPEAIGEATGAEEPEYSRSQGAATDQAGAPPAASAREEGELDA